MEKKSIALVALGILIGMALFDPFSPFQMVVLNQPATQLPGPAPTLQKLKVGYASGIEQHFIVADAGKDRGIWTANGLDPEFVGYYGRANNMEFAKELGLPTGITGSNDVALARAAGMPVKIVAGYRPEPVTKIFVKADSPMKSVKDLDGKKIGSYSTVFDLLISYVNGKFGIRAEVVRTANLTENVVALKLGRIDAFLTGEGAPLRLVDAGELRILFHMKEILPKPFVGSVVWATDDLIQQNPDLVRRFVKAFYETLKHVKENPGYAADLYIKRTNAPKDLAEKVVLQETWAPITDGQILVAAVRNFWQFGKETGAIRADINIKIEDVVDVRFLP